MSGNKRKAVITGIGSVTAVGDNCEKLTSALLNGRTGIHKSSYFHQFVPEITAAAEIQKTIPLKDTWPTQLQKRVKKVTRGKSQPIIDTALSTVVEALSMASIPNLDMSTYEGKAGIVVGGSNLTQNQQDKLHKKYQDSMDYVTPKYALEFFDTNLIGVLSEIFRIDAEGFTVGRASASGNAAILQAYRMVAYGILDACLVVGPMIDFSPYEVQSFRNLGVFGDKFKDNPEKACRPFDKEHEGFILGQGSGAILIESEESAKKRGADILCELLGGAMKLDCNHLSDANADGEYEAMKRALLDAGIALSDVNYINAHGTSTPLGDRVELEAIKHLYEGMEDTPWINSSKCIIGHCMFSAGILECITTILQMKHGFIHPNLNLDKVMEEGAGLHLAGTSTVQGQIQIAINNSFGFGGINSAVVLKNAE